MEKAAGELTFAAFKTIIAVKILFSNPKNSKDYQQIKCHIQTLFPAYTIAAVYLRPSGNVH